MELSKNGIIEGSIVRINRPLISQPFQIGVKKPPNLEFPKFIKVQRITSPNSFICMEGYGWSSLYIKGEIFEKIDYKSLHWEQANAVLRLNEKKGRNDILPPLQKNKEEKLTDKIKTTVTNLIKRASLSPEEKTLIKAGYMNDNLELTTEGKTALQFLSYMQHKEKFVEMAKETIKEIEEA